MATIKKSSEKTPIKKLIQKTIKKSVNKPINEPTNKIANETKTFATFRKKCHIAEDSIRWRNISDKTVKISVSKEDYASGGWNLISLGIMFAFRELGIELDITIRETKKDIDIIIEK